MSDATGVAVVGQVDADLSEEHNSFKDVNFELPLLYNELDEAV